MLMIISSHMCGLLELCSKVHIKICYIYRWDVHAVSFFEEQQHLCYWYCSHWWKKRTEMSEEILRWSHCLSNTQALSGCSTKNVSKAVYIAKGMQTCPREGARAGLNEIVAVTLLNVREPPLKRCPHQGRGQGVFSSGFPPEPEWDHSFQPVHWGSQCTFYANSVFHSKKREHVKVFS